jgi:hypothetical protein
MRRVVLTVAVCLAIQLIQPAPAQAWWGWWDQLSGAGPFRGWELETRLFCFGEQERRPSAGTSRTASEHVKAAYELFFAFAQTQRSASPETRNPEPPKPVSRPRLVVEPALIEAFSDLSALAESAASAPLRETQATELKARVTNVKTAVESLCRTAECTSDQQGSLNWTAGRLRAAETLYAEAATVAKNFFFLPGSAGVTYSACPLERDLHRHGSINMNFRLLETYDNRGHQYAGGNDIRLATLVPTIGWRPLYGLADGWADWVDVSAGAGVYWLTSDGSRPGGFDPLTGVIFEPMRLDMHAPTAVTKKWGIWGALIGAPTLRFGLAIFPAGFKANAFGTTETPEQAERIAGEWVHHWAIFVDPSRVIEWLSTKH